MAYRDWISELHKLPKTADFCLTDVEEHISADGHTINFLVTEAMGEDLDVTRRRGQTKKVCRTRCFVTQDSYQRSPVEVVEPLTEFDRNWKARTSFNLHQFYIQNPKLCESALESLKQKLSVISQSSTAVLAGQLGDEVVKLVTKRLSGENLEDGEGSLKNLLHVQLSEKMSKLIAPVRKLKRNRSVTQFSYVQKDLSWSYNIADGDERVSVFGIQVTWKGIAINWDGGISEVQSNLDELCARDAFLFIVNMPTFGQMIAEKLAKVMEV